MNLTNMLKDQRRITVSDIKEMFENGHEVTVSFFKDCVYQVSNIDESGLRIGSRRMSGIQFHKLIGMYDKDQYDVEVLAGGFTKHVYKFKKPFIEKIKLSEKQIQEGKVTKIDPNNIWDSI